MKWRMFWTLVLCSCFASLAPAQTVTGGGTPGTIPKFTGSTTIGDSPIVDFNGNIGIGMTTPGFPLHVFAGVGGPSVRTEPISILGELRDSTTAASAVEGLASATSGFTNGVLEVSYSSDGNGVLGIGGLNGVRGMTNTTTTFVTGVSGVSLGSTGPGVGVFGQAWSGNGVAGLFANVAGGDIIFGAVGQPATNVFRVDGTGRVFADGGFRPFGADFAEAVQVKGSTESYAPGDLLVIDASGERRLSKSQTPYSTLVAGIYSTQPGVVASQHRASEPLPSNEVPLAVVGIVPCKVSAENGPIEVGDLLVASSTPGHAMKGTDRSKMLGAVVGKALEPLSEGKGVVQVLVTLQ